MNTIIVLIIVLSAIWVYWDATSNKIGKVSDGGGLFNMSAGAWSVVTMFLWIVGFPAYLIKRGSLVERAKAQPVEIKGRGIKLSILCVIGALWILGTLPQST
jgi:hypothetical protein